MARRTDSQCRFAGLLLAAMAMLLLSGCWHKPVTDLSDSAKSTYVYPLYVKHSDPENEYWDVRIAGPFIRNVRKGESGHFRIWPLVGWRTLDKNTDRRGWETTLSTFSLVHLASPSEESDRTKVFSLLHPGLFSIGKLGDSDDDVAITGMWIFPLHMVVMPTIGIVNTDGGRGIFLLPAGIYAHSRGSGDRYRLLATPIAAGGWAHNRSDEAKVRGGGVPVLLTWHVENYENEVATTNFLLYNYYHKTAAEDKHIRKHTLFPLVWWKRDRAENKGHFRLWPLFSRSYRDKDTRWTFMGPLLWDNFPQPKDDTAKPGNTGSSTTGPTMEELADKIQITNIRSIPDPSADVPLGSRVTVSMDYATSPGVTFRMHTRPNEPGNSFSSRVDRHTGTGTIEGYFGFGYDAETEKQVPIEAECSIFLYTDDNRVIRSIPIGKYRFVLSEEQKKQLDLAAKLEAAKDEAARADIVAELLKVAPEKCDINSALAQKWMEENRFSQAALVYARHATELCTDPTHQDILARTALYAGASGEAVTAAEKGLSAGQTAFTPLLIRALANRKGDGDAARARDLLAKWLENPDRLTSLEDDLAEKVRNDEIQAVEAVRALPPDAGSTGRLEQLIEENARKDWKALTWYEDLDQALAEAKKANKPVLLDFTTDWCGWCRVLEKETFSDPRVWKRLRDEFILLRIDGDKQREITARYEVSGYPTIAILDADGKVLVKESGYRPPDAFMTEILDHEQSRKDAGRRETLLQELENHKSNPEDPAYRTALEELVALTRTPSALNEAAWQWVDGRKGHDAAALLMSQKAVAAEPSTGNYMDTLAWCQLRTGDFKGALASFQKSIELGGVDPMLETLGIALAQAKRGNAAEGWSALAKVADSRYAYDRYAAEAYEELIKLPRPANTADVEKATMWAEKSTKVQGGKE